MNLAPSRQSSLAYAAGLALVLAAFAWSRHDASDYIYYFGDGNAVVDLIRVILTTGVWDPNWSQLAGLWHPQPELLPFLEMPKPGEHFYHMGGYMVLGALLCKALALIGLHPPIQMVLRGFNVAIQLGILAALWHTGTRLGHRAIGLLAMALFVCFPLALLEAHYERPESWLCLLTMLLLAACPDFSRRPLRFAVMAGVLIGLSVATKFSQLFLGLVPALLYVRRIAQPGKHDRLATAQRLCAQGLALVACLALALAINTPFVIRYFAATLAGVRHMADFYATPAYPYALPDYHYASQLAFALRYFQSALGTVWCAVFVAGIVELVAHYRKADDAQKDFYLALAVPPVLFFLYSATQVNFIERNFSPWQGALCLITAQGCATLWQLARRASRPAAVALAAVLLPALLWRPVSLDLVLVQRYLHHRDTPPRLDFQQALREDFPGFMIKNVYPDFKATGKPPEHKGKAPRIYQIDDLNEHWTRTALARLDTQGFRRIAIYCSEFHDMPPNTITIYHAAAKNHYYVSDAEWPDAVPKDYFKTNCP